MSNLKYKVINLPRKGDIPPKTRIEFADPRVRARLELIVEEDSGWSKLTKWLGEEFFVPPWAEYEILNGSILVYEDTCH